MNRNHFPPNQGQWCDSRKEKATQKVVDLGRENFLGFFGKGLIRWQLRITPKILRQKKGNFFTKVQWAETTQSYVLKRILLFPLACTVSHSRVAAESLTKRASLVFGVFSFNVLGNQFWTPPTKSILEIFYILCGKNDLL